MSQADASQRGIGYAFYVAVVLCIAQAMANLDRYLVAVVTEPLKHQMQLSDTQLGLLQGPSFVICFALLSVPLGRLADIGNRRWTIFGGIVVWTLSTLACGLARNFNELFAARLLVGVGEAALAPAAMSLLVAYFPKHLLNRGASILTSGGSLGRSGAFLGGGALLTLFTAAGGLHLGGLASFSPWQGLFIVFGLLGLVCAALVLTIREPVRRTGEGSSGTFKAALAYFWANRGAYLPLFLAFSMVAIIVQALAAWAVSSFVRQHGMAPGAAAALLGACSLAVGPGGNLAGGWITDKLATRGVKAPQLVMLTAILLAAVVFAALFWLAPSLPMAAGAYVLLYFTCSMSGPPGYIGVQVLTPDAHRGVTASLFLFTHMLLGAGLGPLVVGLLSDVGLPTLGAALFAATVIASTLGVLPAIFGRKGFEACRQIRIDRPG